MPLSLTADMTTFQEQGYLVIPEVLGPAEVDAAQREIERLHELAAGEPHSKSEATFQFEPHTDVRAERGRPVLRKVERTDLVSDLFAGMAATRGWWRSFRRSSARSCCCSDRR